MTAEPAGGRRGERRLGWKEKVVIPVVVAVIGALAVAALTPVGDGLRELLFPTEATVSGRITIGDQGAAGAELWLDDKRAGNADEQGDFMLEGVRKGTHTLQLRAIGAEQRDFKFPVQRGMTELKVGAIQLNPLVQLGYVVETEGTPRYTGTPGQTTLVVGYELNLWIEPAGDSNVVNQIKSVSYELPVPLPRATVKRISRPFFCHRQKGEVEFLSAVHFGRANAVVDLGNGHRFQISAWPPVGGLSPRPPECPLTGSGASVSPSTTTRQTPTTTRTTVPPTGVVRVPDVVGQTIEAATATLQRFGLSWQDSTVSSAIPKGTVLAQNPRAGVNVAKNTLIRIDISDGSGVGGTRTLEVPDVVGVSRADAASMLNATGFRVRVVFAHTADPAQDGVVLGQNPAGRSQAKQSTVVTITVGRYS